MKQDGNGSVNGGWPIIWWLLGSLCIPVTLPWLIYQLIGTYKAKCLRSKLKDKVVLITGASSGLGESLAHAFYSSGCKIILASRRQEELQRVRDSLLLTHVTVPTHPPVVLTLDLSDLNSLPTHVANVLSIHGYIDILINNGGISYRGNVLTTNVDIDIKVMLVNYFGQVALTKAILPSMIQRGSGHIVAVSSVQGRVAIPFRSAYAASKHALQAFCDTLRAEVAPHNIKVTVLSPGYIRTNLSVNAITGNGTAYGVMDATTASGLQPQRVAEVLLQAVVQDKKEVILSSAAPRIAILLRTLVPNLYFWLMEHRAKKQTNS